MSLILLPFCYIDVPQFNFVKLSRASYKLVTSISKSLSVAFIVAMLLVSHLIHHIISLFHIYFLPLIFLQY